MNTIEENIDDRLPEELEDIMDSDDMTNETLELLKKIYQEKEDRLAQERWDAIVKEIMEGE